MLSPIRIAAAATLALGILALTLRPAAPTHQCGNQACARAMIEAHVASHAMDALSAHHRAMLDRLASGEGLACPAGSVSTCFDPQTPVGVIEAFHAALDRANPDRYQLAVRWSGTVASGPAGSDGEGITLTYSFAPDGTFIPSGVGEPAGASQLFAFLDGIYPSTATWQNIYHDMFARWGQLTGITYIYEPNDDATDFFSAPGVLGLRGDIRLAGKPIDGNSGILAYNPYPIDGADMVIDTSDASFTNLSNDSRTLRNVLSHEHGHGLGLAHVCPIVGQKLMEPTIGGLDGPRHDDIRAAQDYYADPFEPDNSSAHANALGAASPPQTLTPGDISPPIPNSSRLGLHASGEEDWFVFSTDDESSLSITLQPLGSSYPDNPQACAGQPALCCSGATTDSRLIADLAVQLIASDGSTALATADGNGPGLAESILAFASSGPDTFYIRVYETGAPFTQTQLYGLDIEVGIPIPPGAFSLLAPPSGSTGVESGPLMQWSASIAAETYLIEIDTSAAFTGPIVSQIVPAPATEVDLPDDTLAPLTVYFWRVTAANPQGQIVSVPSIAILTTADFVPSVCVADLDASGATDVLDFAIFAANFGTSGHAPLTNGDLDADADVDVLDFAIFANAFGCTTIEN
jgi:hypothetical protein